jgi:single stranded DNA-binding protein
MNECHFLGYFTKKPELKTVGAQGTPVINFSLNVARKYKRANGETVKENNYFDFEIWDTGAETIARHCDVGMPIIVHCSAKQEVWEKDGVKRQRTKFRVNKFDFVPWKKDGVESTVQEETEPEDLDGDDNSSKEDIPF